MTQRTNGNGNGAGSAASEITVAVISGALNVLDKGGHRVVRLIDVVMLSVEAALRLGLLGVEAERMARHIQDELVECLARNGVRIIDAEDGAMWLPETERKTERQGSEPHAMEASDD